MSKYRDLHWLSPMLPVMAIMRLGRMVGRPGPFVAPVARLFMQAKSMPRALRRYRPRDHDVFIATFLKSGTNWSMQIAQQIAWNGRAEFDHIHDVVPWPEAPLRHIISLSEVPAQGHSPTGCRVIKAHLPAHLLPYDSKVQYITVLRDPKAVVVSAYHFLLGMLGVREQIALEEWFQIAVQRDLLIDSWSEHAAGFWAWRDRPNVLVLTYASMKDDLPAAVDRFAAQMGVTLGADARAEVIRRSGFEYMREHEEQFCPPLLPLRGGIPRPLMMRRGEARGSSEMLDASQMDEIDRKTRARLRDLGSDLPYDQLFGG